MIAELTAFRGALLSTAWVWPRCAETPPGASCRRPGHAPGEVMEDNVREVVEGKEIRTTTTSRTTSTSSTAVWPTTANFEFPDDERASFPALRFLGLQIRDEHGKTDQTWMQDQIMDIEMPEMLGTVRKSFKGLLSDAPVKRGFGSPDMLPPE